MVYINPERVHCPFTVTSHLWVCIIGHDLPLTLPQWPSYYTTPNSMDRFHFNYYLLLWPGLLHCKVRRYMFHFDLKHSFDFHYTSEPRRTLHLKTERLKQDTKKKKKTQQTNRKYIHMVCFFCI